MENTPRDEKRPADDTRPTARRGGPNVWLIATILAVLGLYLILNSGPQRSEPTYDFFLEQVRSGNVAYVRLGEYYAEGVFREAPEAPRRINPQTGEPERPNDEKTGAVKKLNKNFRVILPRNDRALGELTALLQEENVR